MRVDGRTFPAFTMALNLTNMKLLLRILNVFSSIKILILVAIIGIGVYQASFVGETSRTVPDQYVWADVDHV